MMCDKERNTLYGYYVGITQDMCRVFLVVMLVRLRALYANYGNYEITLSDRYVRCCV